MTRSSPLFLDALEEAQTAHPELRSGQILVNALGEEQMFYMEDDEAAQRILAWSWDYIQEKEARYS